MKRKTSVTSSKQRKTRSNVKEGPQGSSFDYTNLNKSIENYGVGGLTKHEGKAVKLFVDEITKLPCLVAIDNSKWSPHAVHPQFGRGPMQAGDVLGGPSPDNTVYVDSSTGREISKEEFIEINEQFLKTLPTLAEEVKLAQLIEKRKITYRISNFFKNLFKFKKETK